MLTLSQIYMRLEDESPSPADLDRFAEITYEISEVGAGEFFPFRETGISVRVQEGSIDVWIIIRTIAPALIRVIKEYGEISGALSDLSDRARKVRDFIRQGLTSRTRSQIITSRVTTGDLARLHKIARSIQAGSYSLDEALQKATSVFRRAGEEVTPEMLDEMGTLFEGLEAFPVEQRPSLPAEAGRRPSASILPAQSSVGEQLEEAPRMIPQRRPRGIEIWRDPGETTPHKRRL
jgi:hypothetical protein